jgi:Zn-dependent protease with chaperone function
MMRFVIAHEVGHALGFHTIWGELRYMHRVRNAAFTKTE